MATPTLTLEEFESKKNEGFTKEKDALVSDIINTIDYDAEYDEEYDDYDAEYDVISHIASCIEDKIPIIDPNDDNLLYYFRVYCVLLYEYAIDLFPSTYKEYIASNLVRLLKDKKLDDSIVGQLERIAKKLLFDDINFGVLTPSPTSSASITSHQVLPVGANGGSTKKMSKHMKNGKKAKESRESRSR
jgi:hypothetical protein